jgi:hypothetical protein
MKSKSLRASEPRTLRTRLFRVAAVAFGLSVVVACGSRTGLFVDEYATGTTPGLDGGRTDASDAARDTGRDAITIDALPPIDAQPRPDVVRNDCPDADATLVYLVSQDNELLSYFPTDGTFRLIGNLSCPANDSTNPFSMAVDRLGTAFVLFNDGNLFRASTATGACIALPYTPAQLNYRTFGMGFATNDLGPTETLYVAGDGQGGAAAGLARIDTQNFKLTPIDDFSPPIDRAELTGTGDGRLFAFYTKASRPGSFVGEVSKTTGQVLAETPLPTVEQGQGWAFAFWGGDFYLFTASSGSGSTITRYRPSDQSLTVVGSWPRVIVGAGVSTCAPQQ